MFGRRDWSKRRPLSEAMSTKRKEESLSSSKDLIEKMKRTRRMFETGALKIPRIE